MASRRLWLYWALYIGLALFTAPIAADYYPPSQSSANLTSEHSSHPYTTPSHSGYPLPVNASHPVSHDCEHQSEHSHHSGYAHPSGHSSCNHSHPASQYSRPHPTPLADDCSTSHSAHYTPQPYSSHSAENYSPPRHSGYYPSHSEHSSPDHTGPHSHHHHSNHSTHEPTKCITVTSRSRWGSDSPTHYPETGRSHPHSVKTLTQPCGCPFPAPTVYEKEDYDNAHGKEVTIVKSASSCLNCPVVTKSLFPDCPAVTSGFCAVPDCVILKSTTVPCGCNGLSTTTKCDGLCHSECSTQFSIVPLPCPFTGIGSGAPLGASTVPTLPTAYGG